MNLLIKLHESQSNRQFGRDIYPPESRLMGEVLKFTAAIPMGSTLYYTPGQLQFKYCLWKQKETHLDSSTSQEHQNILPPNQQMAHGVCFGMWVNPQVFVCWAFQVRTKQVWDPRADATQHPEPGTHVRGWSSLNSNRRDVRSLISRLRLLARLQYTSIYSSSFPLISHKKKKSQQKK